MPLYQSTLRTHPLTFRPFSVNEGASGRVATIGIPPGTPSHNLAPHKKHLRKHL